MTLLFGSIALAQIARPALEAHPEALPPEEGCDRFEGSAAGNDPTVRLVVVLCETDGAVTGKLQWSSLTSGWNVRRIEGRREGDAYVLADVGIEAEKPEPGWRFCKVDAYALERRGDQIVGSYDSASCNDHAQVTLARLGTAATPDALGTPEPTAAREPESSSGSALCVTAPAPLGAFVFAALAMRRRRRG